MGYSEIRESDRQLNRQLLALACIDLALVLAFGASIAVGLYFANNLAGYSVLFIVAILVYFIRQKIHIKIKYLQAYKRKS